MWKENLQIIRSHLVLFSRHPFNILFKYSDVARSLQNLLLIAVIALCKWKCLLSGEPFLFIYLFIYLFFFWGGGGGGSLILQGVASSK